MQVANGGLLSVNRDHQKTNFHMHAVLKLDSFSSCGKRHYIYGILKTHGDAYSLTFSMKKRYNHHFKKQTNIRLRVKLAKP